MPETLRVLAPSLNGLAAGGHGSAPVQRRGPTPLGARPNVVLVGVVLGAAVVLLLWWRGTPYVHGMGDWLTNGGRITGLLAGYSIGIVLLFMARIPALEHGVGSDRLARWHAVGGRYTVSLVVCHVVLIVWGYAITAHTNPVHQTVSLVSSYPDIAMATVAAGLLVFVGAVSARAARRRLSYETWHYLHLYTYVAVSLAFSHQLATGAQFISDPLARAAWSSFYVVIGALLIWHRLLSPVRSAWRHRMRVVGLTTEGPGVVSVYISGDHLDELDAQPGQFFRWRFLTREHWWAANPYSLSAAPRPALLRITVKALGDHSGDLAGVRVGTKVLAEGPYGGFTAARRKRRKVLLIAAGVGITPIRTLFETLPGAPGDITLLYRVSSREIVLFQDELEAIADKRGHRLYLLSGPRGGTGDPLSAGRLAKAIPDVRQHDVYLCGPPAMTEATIRTLRRCGVSRRRIHRESFEL
ncbi:MAG TPA: ferredoxin reductase family protein [Acidothermaceae bacterium]|nr:ferredoxin reductase family protein [Acidothermaceae bacterium]